MQNESYTPDCAYMLFGEYTLAFAGCIGKSVSQGKCNYCNERFTHEPVTLSVVTAKVTASCICRKCGHINKLMEASITLMTCLQDQCPAITR